LDEPHSVASEAYKTLRTSTLFVASNREAKMLLIAGPYAAEGKTATLANLGVSLANADRRVIIASADLRRPRLHQFFKLENESGITTVLSGETQLHESLMRVGVDKLRVLPSGPPPMNPAEVLGSEAMGMLLDELRGLADLILLDSPPVLAVADAIVLAPLTDGIIFVADPSKSSRSAVVNAVRQLEQVNAHVIGGVLNNFDISGASPYDYNYGYAPTLEQPTGSTQTPSRFKLRKQARY
jgi:capsular exopolysaccharide synthesis family protein